MLFLLLFRKRFCAELVFSNRIQSFFKQFHFNYKQTDNNERHFQWIFCQIFYGIHKTLGLATKKEKLKEKRFYSLGQFQISSSFTFNSPATDHSDFQLICHTINSNRTANLQLTTFNASIFDQKLFQLANEQLQAQLQRQLQLRSCSVYWCRKSLLNEAQQVDATYQLAPCHHYIFHVFYSAKTIGNSYGRHGTVLPKWMAKYCLYGVNVA